MYKQLIYILLLVAFFTISCKDKSENYQEIYPVDDPELYEKDEPDTPYPSMPKVEKVKEKEISDFENFKATNFIDGNTKSFQFSQENYVEVMDDYFYKPVEQNMLLRFFFVNRGKIYFIKIINSFALFSYSTLDDTQIIYNVKGHVEDAAYFSKKIEVDVKTTQYLLDRENPRPGRVAKNGKCVFITSSFSEIVEKDDKQLAKIKEGLNLLNAYILSHEGETDQSVMADLLKKAIMD